MEQIDPVGLDLKVMAKTSDVVTSGPSGTKRRKPLARGIRTEPSVLAPSKRVIQTRLPAPNHNHHRQANLNRSG